MKKTIKINISGLVFHIDEDAYERLSIYLEKLEVRFRGTPGAQEIMADIEARIAEIFQSHTSDEKESVVITDVEEAIGILGEPEDFTDAEEGEVPFEDPEKERHYRSSRRRLYRDADSKVIGGVCGGIGEYLGIDPAIVRILFAVFFLLWGIGLLVYLLLWIAIPEAITTAEKLEMKGERINVDNIERSIRNEYNGVKENIKNIPKSRGYKRTRSGINSIGRAIGHILAAFIKIIGILIGVLFIIIGIALLVGVIGGLVAGQTWLLGDLWDWQQYSLPEVLSLFVDESVAILALISMLLIIGIPILALIYGGVKLLFPFHANGKAIGLSSLGIWVVALVLLSIFTASEAMKYNDSERIAENVSLKLPDKNLYLMVTGTKDNDPKQLTINFGYRHEVRVAEEGRNLVLMGLPSLDVVKSNNDEAEMIIRRESRGLNEIVARRHAKEIQYAYTIRDSFLVIDPYFRLGKDEKWRDQDLEIVISLPVGYRIFLDESSRDYLKGVDNQENIWSEYMVGHDWVMEEKGLTRADKD